MVKDLTKLTRVAMAFVFVAALVTQAPAQLRQISGYILRPDGTPVANIGLTTGTTTRYTDVSGSYTVFVPNNWASNVTVVAATIPPGWQVAPTYRAYSAVTSNQTGQNFEAHPPPTGVFGGGVLYWETGGKVVVEAERYSWMSVMSNSLPIRPRAWLRNSETSGPLGAWHHPNTSQGFWDNQYITSNGPSRDFIYSAITNPLNVETGQNRAGGGSDGPVNQEAGVGWIIRFNTPGRYFVYARTLEMRGSDSNRTHWQFDWLPVHDPRGPVKSWAPGDSKSNNRRWQWDGGREGIQAIYVPRPGTYWLRAYHNEMEDCLDQIVMVRSVAPTLPSLPADTFKDVESTTYAISSPVTMTRRLGTLSFTPGAGAIVTTLTASAAVGVGNMTIITTETLPVGWTATNVVVSTGAVTGVGTNVLVWTAVPIHAGETPWIKYDSVPGVPAVACGTAFWLGVTNGFPILGDYYANQLETAGDGWTNSGMDWAESVDIGNATGHPPGSTGSRWFACDNRFELIGSGEDVWNTVDEFHFLSKYMAGNCAIEAVIGMDRPPDHYDTWSKGGIMIRDSYAAGAPYACALIRRDSQLQMQYRDNPNVESGSATAPGPQNRMNPAWVRLTRSGTNITGGYDTYDGDRNLSAITRSIPGLQGPVAIGLFVTRHRGDGNTDVARYQFWNVVTTGTVIPAARTIAKIERATLPTTYTANGMIGGTIRLTATPLGPGGPLLTTETLPAFTWVMPGSIVVTPGTTVTLSPPVNPRTIVWTTSAPLTLSAPATLQYQVATAATLLRTPLEFRGVFWNGVDVDHVAGIQPGGADWQMSRILGAELMLRTYTWIPGIGYNRSTNKMLGMGDNGLMASGWPILWTQAIGTERRQGYAQYFAADNSFFVTTAYGNDIWGNSDPGFRFTYMRVNGDFDIRGTCEWLICRAVEWPKVGIMVRDSTNADAANAFIMLKGNAGSSPNDETRAHPIKAQCRPTNGAASVNNDSGWPGGTTGDVSNNGPAELRLRRVGTVCLLGYDNLEGGQNWAWRTVDMTGIRVSGALLGFAVSTHDSDNVAMARFTDLQVTATPVPPMGVGTRSFGAVTQATLGTPVNVSISVPRLTLGTTVTIVERYPSYCFVDRVGQGGVITSPGMIQWKVFPWPSGGNAVVDYWLTPKWNGDYMPLKFEGAYSEDGCAKLRSRQPITDSVLPQAGTRIFRQEGLAPAVGQPPYVGTEDTVVAGTTAYVDNNMGANDFLEEGHTGASPLTNHRKLLIQFKNLPTSATVPLASVDLALLRLWHDRMTTGTALAHNIRTQRISPIWTEGAGTGANGRAALANEVTWRSVRHLLAPAWSIAGLMGASDVGTFNTPGTTYGLTRPTWVDIDVKTDVVDFLTTPVLNKGWKVSQDKVRGVADNNAGNTYVTTQGLYAFKSSENADVAHRPVLLVMDNTRYVAGSIGTVTRSFTSNPPTPPGTYEWSSTSTLGHPDRKPLTVNITVQNLTPMTSISLVEMLPPGLVLPTTPPTVLAVTNISNNGQWVGDRVVWNSLAPFNTNITVSYDLVVLWTMKYHHTLGTYPPLWFEGGYAEDAAGGQRVNTAPAMIPHANTYVFQQGNLPSAFYTGNTDTCIAAVAPDNNMGALRRIEEGDDSANGLDRHRSILMQFTGLPPYDPATTIVKGTLMLYATGERTGNKHNAHGLRAWRLIKLWNEGAGNVEWDGRTGLVTETTWNRAQVGTITPVPWQIPGAMGVEDVSVSEPVTQWNAQYPGWVSLDVTNTVIDMMTTPSLNVGWKISQDKVKGVPANSANNAFVSGIYQFVSRNTPTAEIPIIYRPLLVVRPWVTVSVEISRFMLD